MTARFKGTTISPENSDESEGFSQKSLRGDLERFYQPWQRQAGQKPDFEGSGVNLRVLLLYLIPCDGKISGRRRNAQAPIAVLMNQSVYGGMKHGRKTCEE